MNKLFWVLLFICCGCGDNHRAWTSTDSWFNPPPIAIDFNTGNEVSDSLVITVLPTAIESAESLLSNATFVELNAIKASEFAGRQIFASAQNRIYLLRSVYLGSPVKGFTVQISRDTLLVSHGSLGHEAVPMKRHALIVLLNRSPRAVFNNCYRDE